MGQSLPQQKLFWKTFDKMQTHGLSSSIANASRNTSNPYSSKCPEMMTIIECHVRTVVYDEPRMAA